MACTQHSSEKKNRLIEAIQAGKSILETAKLIKIPFETVKKIWAKFCQNGLTKNKSRSGQPSEVNDWIHQALVWTARKNRRVSFWKIENMVKSHLSATTVRTHFAEEGYHCQVGRKIPFFKSNQKRKRLAWTKQYCNQNWKKVIWSDKSYMYIGDIKGWIFMTCRADKEFEEDCLISTFKQFSIYVIIWSCIIKDRKGLLVVL